MSGNRVYPSPDHSDRQNSEAYPADGWNVVFVLIALLVLQGATILRLNGTIAKKDTQIAKMQETITQLQTKAPEKPCWATQFGGTCR